MFTMPPPNELLNEQHVSLDEILWPNSTEVKKRRINVPHDFEPYNDDDGARILIPPILWNGHTFTLLCFGCESLIQSLLASEATNFSLPSRNKIAIQLKKLFETYILHHSHYTKIRNEESLCQTDAERLNSLYVPLTADQATAAKRSFERALMVVTQWAMCDFSRRRSNWAEVDANGIAVRVREVERIDISAVELSAEEQASLVSTRKKPSHLTAAQLLEKKQLATLRRKVAALKKKGLIKEPVAMLDDTEQWSTDYVEPENTLPQETEDSNE